MNKLIVTASSALAACAAAVAIAAPASAVPTSVWDRVAACESNGRWHTNTGNGFHGGIQIAPSTWAEFGGHRYAQRADLASKAHQIAIAERVLAVQGPKAWPNCF